MPPTVISQAASEGLWADLNARLPQLETSLPSITVPVGVLLGERSPIPARAGVDTADRVPGAWWHAEPDAGHFLWVEAPGAVLTAMDRLTGASPLSG
jgi:pimeloyl-ACP methyl ester carboxylesterase